MSGTSLNQHCFLFKLATVFLTRLPLKIEQDVDEAALNRASGYFPLVGLLLALILALVAAVASLWLSSSVTIALVMVASLMLTGAFHEDGLADAADGLGGGWTVEQKLNIMKDSRLGTYGASALFCLLLLKFLLLSELLQTSFMLLVIGLLLGHVLSRGFAVSLIGLMDYVQLDEQSKTKPVAKNLPQESQSLLFFSCGAVLLLAYLVSPLGLWFLMILVALLFLLRSVVIRFFNSQLGGYTGDLLGAVQQIFELCIYLALVVMYVD